MDSSSKKRIYLTVAILGFILPYSQLILFLLENGIDLNLILEQVVQVRLGAFAWLDVIVSAIALFTFIYFDRSKNIKRSWIAIVGTCLVGVSFGLPIYLYLRESSLED